MEFKTRHFTVRETNVYNNIYRYDAMHLEAPCGSLLVSMEEDICCVIEHCFGGLTYVFREVCEAFVREIGRPVYFKLKENDKKDSVILETLLQMGAVKMQDDEFETIWCEEDRTVYRLDTK